MSKSDIEKCLNSRGNFIKIDYLDRFLKEDISIDMKKFGYLKLAETYENMKLFGDAGGIFQSLAILSMTFSEKRKHYMKGCTLYIRAGEFGRADEFMQKAMSQSNSFEKKEIYEKIKGFYKKIAENYETEKKRNKASKVYEKILEMKINDFERKEIKEKLTELYEKLGKKYIE